MERRRRGLAFGKALLGFLGSLGLVIEIPLESSDDVQELCQGFHIHFREIVLFQFCKMPVVAYNISGTSSDGTIHKFIVVRVSLDEIEAIKG